MPSECAAVGCSEKLTKEFFIHAFPLKKKWSQKSTVASISESMGPSHKEVGTKKHDVLCSKHLEKNASQIAPCWAFSLGWNTCPHGNRLGKISSSNQSKDEAPTPLPVVGPLFISPLSFHLSRALLGAWRFGLFRCVYSSFHNRLDLIREPAFYWVFYYIFPIYPCLFHHT